MDQKRIGLFLKELRKEKGLTQEQLADIFNVSNRSVSRWENGKNMPDLSLLVQLADFYEVDIREIIDGERKDELSKSDVKETITHVSEYTQINVEQKLKKRHRLSLFVTICLSVILLIVLNSKMNIQNHNSEEYTAYKYTVEDIKKEIISDQNLNDDIKLSLIETINDDKYDYWIIKTKCDVTNEYVCYPYFYVTSLKSSSSSLQSIETILCGNINFDNNGTKKCFTGNLFYYLENNHTVFWDINGDFSHNGTTSVQLDKSSSSIGQMLYYNSLYYNENVYTYTHKSGKIIIR